MGITIDNPFIVDNINYEDIFLLSLQLEKKKKIAEVNAPSLNLKSNWIKNKITYLKNGIQNKVSASLNLYQECLLEYTNPTIDHSEFILFATEPTEVKQLQILYNRIQAEGKSAVMSTDRINICKKLRKNGLKTYFFRKNNHSSYQKKNEKNLKELNQTIDPITVNFLNEYMPKFIGLSKKIRQFLKNQQPKHVFVGYDLTQEGRLMSTIAKQLNIPSYTIQHGLVYKDDIHSKHIVDRYFVYGQNSAEILTSSGFPVNKIVVTGAPYMEKHYDEINRSSKLYTNKILICLSGVGHSTSLQHHIEIIKAIALCANEQRNISFLIKLHRKDNIQFYEEILKLNNVQLINTSEENSDDIFHFLKNVDALITGSSSTATEAMIYRIPVITVDLLNEYEEIDFIKADVTFHAKDTKSINSNLRSILENETQIREKIKSAENFAHNYFSVGLKKPTEEILNNLLFN